MRRILLVILVLLCLTAAQASRPVHRKSTGCVLNGRVYTIYDSQTVYRYTLSRPMSLRRYEGKLIELDGTLLPGDRFTPRTHHFKTLGPVPARVRKVVAQYEGSRVQPGWR